LSWLRKRVCDKALAVTLDDSEHIPEDISAVWILEVADVLAGHLRLRRVHQNGQLRVEDGEIAVFAVAHVAEAVHCSLLRFRFAQGAGCRLIAKGFDDTQRDVGRVSEVRLALVQTHVSGLVSAVDGDAGKTQQTQDQRQPELLSKR
jgi:hypothetical protein